jgi:periplasmic glucans biosynthesis protein
MGDKVPNDPMHRPLPMHQSPRCGARTRSGSPCRSPAVKGKRRCRMHGAYAGPPRGNGNAWKHGGRSAEMLRLWRQVRELLRESRELVERVR